VEPLQGFVELGDSRIMSAGLQLDMMNKKIVSTSFYAEWKCLRCDEHGDSPAFKTRGIPDSTCSRQVVILSDQSFPACLPAEGQQECVKILLVENASIRDLTEIFLQKLGNRRVPPGSVIMIFSAAFLATAGLELYTLELVESEKRIHNVLGRETIFQPLPPVLLRGTSDANLAHRIETRNRMRYQRHVFKTELLNIESFLKESSNM
jgi:hypothetical protein